MDATALGALLVGVGAVAGAIVTWLGKRGENALAVYTSLTGDLQEERDGYRAERDDYRLQLTEAHAQHAAAQAEIARLRGKIIQLGGDPS